MTLTMSGRPFYDWFPVSNTWFLGCFRNTVDVTAERDDRFAVSPFCKPRSWYAADAPLDAESILFKYRREIRGSFCFVEAKLRETEDHVHHLLGHFGFCVHGI